jgi:enoyl-CoA hydratase/carnithine racemase
MTEFKTILIEKKDRVATVTLNRPQAKNAMSPQMHFDMVEALEELE